MRGRKPQTAEEKRHAGNPSRRPINEREPVYTRLDGPAPPELTDPIARVEWDRLVPTLQHVTTADRATMLAYCQKYAQWIQLETLAASGPVLVKGAHGGKVANPVIALANRAYTLFLKAAIELGLSPSQRPRVQTVGAPVEAVDAFTAFQRARPPRLARVK